MQILHSQIIGEGRPLVILHGFLGMLDNWKTIGMKLVEKGFQVHLVDARNHGHSFHSDDFSYELMVQDLYYYINHYNLHKVSVLGHSMGGKTAMLFATQFPQYLENLIVVDISPKNYPIHHQIIIDGLSSIDFHVVKTRSQADQQLSKYIVEQGTRQFLLKNIYWKTPERLDFRFNLSALRNHLAEIGKSLPSEAMYQGRTLFLIGEKSNYIKQQDYELIKKHFPEAFCRVIPNAGHWVHSDNPANFIQEIELFLEK